MTRILAIVFLYGGGLLLFAWLVDKAYWKWEQREARKPQPKRIVCRDDGSLAEQAKRRTLDRIMQASQSPHHTPGQRARQYNHPSAPGLDRDRKRVN